MTLRRRLAVRYGLIVAVCLLLLAWLTYHEFVQEPHMFQSLGIEEPAGLELAEWVEVLLYGGVPVFFIVGWWWVRRSLNPIDDLAAEVERVDAENLRKRLPRTMNGDEVDRLAAAFNTMAERLEASFQQVREFTLHASHELKTPLTIMRVQLETMIEGDKTLTPAQVEWLECELNEVQRLSRIVDSLTLLTKADAGLVKLARTPVSLNELVQECFEDAVILAEPQGVRVTLSACDPAQVLGDRDRLRQLLLNLADNAIKYNRRDGSVRLALHCREGNAELEVTNTGEGVPPDLQVRVFERFVRGQEASTRAIEGSGLGLSLCRWIVHAHGGAIELTSEPGRSTTVRVRLPLAGRKMNTN